MKFSFPKSFPKKPLQRQVLGKRVLFALEFIAIHAFEASIGAIALAIAIGLIIIALSYRSLPLQEALPQEKKIRFSQELYQQVLEELKEREKAFEAAEKKGYPNLFIPAVLTQEGEKVK